MIDPITLILADDHAITRHGVRALIETQTDMSVLGEASNGHEAVKLVVEHAPDVALVDMSMPGLNGIEVTRQIKRHSPRTQVVILTSYVEDSFLLPSIQAGALSYLMKDLSPAELLAAIRKAAIGEASIQPRLAARLMKAIREPASQQDRFAELSERELEVLRLIAEGLSNSQIAERLGISSKTVKSHVSNVLGKLQLGDRTQAAVFAWKEGLVRPKVNP